MHVLTPSVSAHFQVSNLITALRQSERLYNTTNIHDNAVFSVAYRHFLCYAEIFEFETNDDDKFLILASDGVWEFLSNDEVIDLIIPYWHRNDLKGACSTVVKESVAAWEREEDSIDDITCIIVFFKRSGPIHDYSQARSSEAHQREQP